MQLVLSFVNWSTKEAEVVNIMARTVAEGRHEYWYPVLGGVDHYRELIL